MRGLAFALVCGGGLLSACSSGQDKGETTTAVGSPEQIVQTAIQAMEDLDSYHLVSLTIPDSDPLNESVADVDFVAPDTHRLVTVRLLGKERNECTRTEGPSGSSESCFPILDEIEEKYFYEAVLISRGAYFRTREEEIGEEPGDWSDWGFYPSEQSALLLGGSASLTAGWLIRVLRDATDLASAGVDRGLTHITGKYNPVRIALDLRREAAEEAGEDTFGEECSSDSGCREFTFEDLVEANQSAIAHFDEEPAPFDVWISAEGHRVHRFSATGPEDHLRSADESGGFPFEVEFRSVSLEMRFSRFNDVVIEIPRVDPE